MAEIHRLSGETVVEFIRRQPYDEATTLNVAHRFSWDRRQAYKILRQLQKEGRVVQVLPHMRNPLKIYENDAAHWRAVKEA